MNVLFVCLGNICRSPIAEAIFKQLVADEDLSAKIHVDSAGTSSEEEGNGPHPGAAKTMRAHGLSTDGLISRPITQQDFKWADYIICMDNMNLYRLQQMAPASDRHKIHLAYEVIPNKATQEIPDPWYTHRFEDTYNSLMETLPQWLEEMKKAIN